MSVPAESLDPALGDHGPADRTETLFAYEARRQVRVVVRVVGLQAGGDRIRVAAEIYPVDVPETNEPQRRFYDFPTRQKAQAFADEALLALEYLGCTVLDFAEALSRAQTGLAGAWTPLPSLDGPAAGLA
jgi:hypothetical protein